MTERKWEWDLNVRVRVVVGAVGAKVYAGLSPDSLDTLLITHLTPQLIPPPLSRRHPLLTPSRSRKPADPGFHCIF